MYMFYALNIVITKITQNSNFTQFYIYNMIKASHDHAPEKQYNEK